MLPRPRQKVAFASAPQLRVDLGFLQTVAEKKLHEWRLQITGPWLIPAKHSMASMVVQLTADSLADLISVPTTTLESVPGLKLPANGVSLATAFHDYAGDTNIPVLMWQFDSMHALRLLDYQAIIQVMGNQVWHAVGESRQAKCLLQMALLVMFVDLKQYRFYWWSAWPTWIPADSLLCWPLLPGEGEPWSDNAASTWSGVDPALVHQTPLSINSQQRWVAASIAQHLDPVYIGLSKMDQWPSAAQGAELSREDEEMVLPWRFRNWLIRSAYSICQKCAEPSELERTLTLRLVDPSGKRSQLWVILVPAALGQASIPMCIGWERNEFGKLAPRFLDLASQLDSSLVAEQAANLNLNLIKWRLVPQLDLRLVARQRCLLLGMGTLGSNIARGLMAWGIRDVTLLDGGSVSHSNLVRQPLYLFSDIGRPKVEAAAQHLTSILPSMRLSSVRMQIPMPGHRFTDREDTCKRISQLDQLIARNDVIFLLTDSRESRWLPTLIAAHHDKRVVNVALGFDSFVVMRHGLRVDANRLGCYFCNDIVAPMDSMSKRTLDQQCTVTRPGLAMVASGFAVEFLAAWLQPLSESGQSVLGSVPHQIRGSVSLETETVRLTGQAYPRCTACSDRVLAAYNREHEEFIWKSLNDPEGYLLDRCGIREELATMKSDFDDPGDMEPVYEDDEFIQI